MTRRPIIALLLLVAPLVVSCGSSGDGEQPLVQPTCERLPDEELEDCFVEDDGEIDVSRPEGLQVFCESRCTKLRDSLSFSYRPWLKNLDFLRNIKQMDGLNLEATGITNLRGMENVKEVSYLTIDSNSQLESLEGLENLETVTTRLIISQNDKLQRIDNFDKLEIVDFEGFQIIGNANLESIEGLNSLQTAANLSIGSNPQLQRVEGFSQLQVIKTLGIGDNPKLQRITGFEALSVANRNFTIRENDQLQTIEGFDKLSTIKDALMVHDNPRLAQCRVDELFGDVRADERMVFGNDDEATCP